MRLTLLFFNLFYYFWLPWVFVAARGLCLSLASRSYPLVAGHGPWAHRHQWLSFFGRWILNAWTIREVARALSTMGQSLLPPGGNRFPWHLGGSCLINGAEQLCDFRIKVITLKVTVSTKSIHLSKHLPLEPSTCPEEAQATRRSHV